MDVLVLPGMDGGDALSAVFRARLSSRHAVAGAQLPPGQADYGRYESWLRRRLRGAGPTAVIAESFSGPVAICLAADPPPELHAVVLVSTFAVGPPYGALLARGVTSRVFAAPPPSLAIRRFMVGRDASSGSVAAVRLAVSQATDAVLAARLRSVLRVDVRAELARVRVPTLVVRPTADRLLPAAMDVLRHAPCLPSIELDGPHLLLHARPQLSAEAIGGWLRGLRCEGESPR